jgi:hypothetical protein
MARTAEELRGILAAYQKVMEASWPEVHPELRRASQHWATAPADALELELQRYLEADSRPGVRVRVFWKMLPGYRFAGFSRHFAHDAGLPAAELLGSDDFDPRLPWALQAAKYRADDEAVVDTGEPRLDIIERQRGSDGTITWVRVGKAPITTQRGVIGLLGMYEVLSPEEGRRLFAERSSRPREA